LLVYSLIMIVSEAECSIAKKRRSLLIAEDTRWCGAGHIAENCDDLGRLNKTDSCCREHDHCPYTFSKYAPSYNGFTTNFFYSLSHCECDSIFSDCLHEKPYKEGSFMIREAFFVDLAAKCFAYLPCDDDAQILYSNIWNNVSNRRVGTCHSQYKVVVFANHTDYQTYIRQNLNDWQFQMLQNKLKHDYSNLISLSKKTDHCFDQFKDIPQKIADSFVNFYLNINNKKEAEYEIEPEYEFPEPEHPKSEHPEHEPVTKIVPEPVDESIPEHVPEPKLDLTTTKSETSNPVLETTTLVEAKKNDSLIVLDYNGKTIEMSLLFFVILCAVVFLGLVVWIAFIVIHVKKIFSDYKLIRNKSSNTLLDNYTPTKQIPC